jgi:hypothetical protein
LPDFLSTFDWSDGIGVIGSFLIAGAYYCVSTGRLSAEKPLFQWLNLVGSILILFSLWFRPNPGAIMIEFLWASIAILTLTTIYIRKK